MIWSVHGWRPTGQERTGPGQRRPGRRRAHGGGPRSVPEEKAGREKENSQNRAWECVLSEAEPQAATSFLGAEMPFLQSGLGRHERRVSGWKGPPGTWG